MQALVGFFCFSLLLATGTCLECESCSAFKKNCTGKSELCSGDKDTCATILIEITLGQSTSVSVVKSCFQKSQCLGRREENAVMKVNLKIECSSSPAGKMKRSEGNEALAYSRNELPESQILPEYFKQPTVANPETSPGEPDPTSKNEETTTPTGKPTPPTGNSTTTPLVATTLRGNAQQTAASFVLAVSSLLLMKIAL